MIFDRAAGFGSEALSKRRQAIAIAGNQDQVIAAPARRSA